MELLHKGQNQEVIELSQGVQHHVNVELSQIGLNLCRCRAVIGENQVDEELSQGGQNQVRIWLSQGGQNQVDI